MSFTLLWGKILESSLWVQESKETRLVWITMLAMKDKDGIVQASVVGLADRAKVSPDECRESLAILLAPDRNDTSKVDEGRRIHEVPGGWQIVNHDLYRFSTPARREVWREEKAKQRKTGKPKRSKLGDSPVETAYCKAFGDGDDAECDRLAAIPLKHLGETVTPLNR